MDFCSFLLWFEYKPRPLTKSWQIWKYSLFAVICYLGLTLAFQLILFPNFKMIPAKFSVGFGWNWNTFVQFSGRARSLLKSRYICIIWGQKKRIKFEAEFQLKSRYIWTIWVQSFLGLTLDLHLFNLPTSRFPSAWWRKENITFLSSWRFAFFLSGVVPVVWHVSKNMCWWRWLWVHHVCPFACESESKNMWKWKHVLMAVALSASCLPTCYLSNYQTCTMRKSQRQVHRGNSAHLHISGLLTLLLQTVLQTFTRMRTSQKRF